MISFHPTLTPISFVQYVSASLVSFANDKKLIAIFGECFPNHGAMLTDSGRSALAVVIESLALRGKTMLLPAYVCDSLYPILRAYDIKPIFLDVDEATFQPPLAAYTDELVEKADAVILVATYGKKPDDTVVEHLKDRNILIIEDFAGRDPRFVDPLSGTARIYSLPKTFPVPDGGLAIVQKGIDTGTLKAHRASLGWYKNVLKLFPGVAPLIARIRDNRKTKQTEPTWDGIHSASTLTKHVLKNYAKERPTVRNTPYPYCVPLLVENPEWAVRQLRALGVSTERIWHRPIVMHPEIAKHYDLTVADFPVTEKLASEIVCAPLWHIKDNTTLAEYTSSLEKTLS